MAIVAAALLALLALPAAHARVGGDCTPTSGDTFMLRTNSDLDALNAECSRMVGNVFLQCDVADPITNLEVFRYVSEITGYLYIDNCDQLTVLDGFRRLQVIAGEETYTFPNGDEGYALVIINNDNLESLGGLQNLTDILGDNHRGHARIRIAENAQLCYIYTANWKRPLTRNWERLFDVSDGDNAGCDVLKCAPECSCGSCFGPETQHCQKRCSSDDSEDKVTIAVVLLLCILFLIFAVFVFLFMTDRCGCRMTCGRRRVQIGVTRHDAKEATDVLLKNFTSKHDPLAQSPLVDAHGNIAATNLGVTPARSRFTANRIAPDSLPPLKPQAMPRI